MPGHSGPNEAARHGACTPPAHENAEIYETLRTVLSEKFDIEPARVGPEASLEDLGLDYLAAVEVLTELQDARHLPAGRSLVLPPGATRAHLVEQFGTDADALKSDP
ncbi:phosphopantetheine-binding protein [Actinospica sp.]|uniref:phosphopantetheine-binding protein n=1 Tax=Actinospica sp. TaxID=1872142 RepID=UPI002B9AC9A4|nr:phosphopantetheine-binding protein [Actinospica sp.]HWG26769.1 phosphopantetheine-binding protein [Actinospica sp.]